MNIGIGLVVLLGLGMIDTRLPGQYRPKLGTKETGERKRDPPFRSHAAMRDRDWLIGAW